MSSSGIPTSPQMVFILTLSQWGHTNELWYTLTVIDTLRDILSIVSLNYPILAVFPPGLVFSSILDSMPSYASSRRKALKQGYVADLVR